MNKANTRSDLNFADKNIGTAIIQVKNIFIQLLI